MHIGELIYNSIGTNSSIRSTALTNQNCIIIIKIYLFFIFSPTLVLKYLILTNFGKILFPKGCNMTSLTQQSMHPAVVPPRSGPTSMCRPNHSQHRTPRPRVSPKAPALVQKGVPLTLYHANIQRVLRLTAPRLPRGL